MPVTPKHSPLFAPRSIAVVGASGNHVKIVGGRLMGYLAGSHYAGKIFPVNPKYTTIDGHECYPTVSALPETPDVAAVCLNADAAVESVAELGRRGCRSVIVYSGGFDTDSPDGAARTRRLREILATHPEMSLLGPNCQGMANIQDGVVLNFSATFNGTLDEPAGNVAVVSQSGAVGGVVCSLLRGLGTGVGYLVSTGNEVDVTAADCIRYVATDSRVDVIACYLEGVRDGDDLIDAFGTALARGKRLLVLKSGVSAAGKRAVASHTNAATGEHAVFDALARKLGVQLCADIEDLTVSAATASLAGHGIGKPLRRIGIVTNSGGAGSLLVDGATLRSPVVEVPRLSARLQSRLRTLLPGYAAAANPVDVADSWIEDPSVLRRIAEEMLSSGEVDIVVPLVVMGSSMPGGLRDRVFAEMISLGSRAPSQVLIGWLPDTDDTVRKLRLAGLNAFADTTHCVRAIRTIAEHGTDPLADPASWVASRKDGQSPASAEQSVARGVAGPSRVLPYRAAAERLAAHGIPFVRGIDVSSGEEARERVGELGGEAFAVKIQYSTVVHKAERGGVVVDVPAGDRLAQVVDRLLGIAEEDQEACGVRVEEMAPPGVDIFLGARLDPIFGLVLVTGAGGGMTDLIPGKGILLPPLSAAAVEAAFQESGVDTLLAGYRGGPRGSTAHAVELVSRFAELCRDLGPRLGVIDANPVRCYPDAALVIDCKIELREPATGATGTGG